MGKHTESRIKYLRLALSEAVRAGDREAAKRLTARVMSLLKVSEAPLWQFNAHETSPRGDVFLSTEASR